MEELPNTVRAAAEAAGLGEPRSRYRPEIEFLTFYAGLVSLVGPLFLLLAPVFDDKEFVVIGSAVTLMALLGWREISRRAKDWRYLCEHGILLPPRRSFRWDEVAHLWTWDTTWVDPTIGIFPAHICIVELTDGSRIDLTKLYGDAGPLSDKVETIVGELLYQRRLERLSTDGQVEFGPITVKPSGLLVRSSVVDWGQIAVIEVEPDRVRVRDIDRRVLISQRIKRIPDIDVLLRIVADHGVTCRRITEDQG